MDGTCLQLLEPDTHVSAPARWESCGTPGEEDWEPHDIVHQTEKCRPRKVKGKLGGRRDGGREEGRQRTSKQASD